MSKDGLKYKSESKTGKRSGIHRRVMDGLEIPTNKQIYLVWYAFSQYLHKNGKLSKKLIKDWNLKPVGTYKRNRKVIVLDDGTKISKSIDADEYLSGFDIWWKDNWKELFAEKKIGFVQTVDSIPKKPNKNTIYIEVPLDTSSHILRGKCAEIINDEMKSRKIDKNTKPILTAKYQPDIPQKFDYRVWIRRLCARHLKDDGMTLVDIFSKLRRQKIGLDYMYFGGEVILTTKTKTSTSKSLGYQMHSRSYSSGKTEYHNAARMVSRDIVECDLVLKSVQSGKFSISKPVKKKTPKKKTPKKKTPKKKTP